LHWLCGVNFSKQLIQFIIIPVLPAGC